MSVSLSALKSSLWVVVFFCACVFHNKSFLPSCHRCHLISGKSLSWHLCCRESHNISSVGVRYHSKAMQLLFWRAFTHRNHSAYSLVLLIGVVGWQVEGMWQSCFMRVAKSISYLNLSNNPKFKHEINQICSWCLFMIENDVLVLTCSQWKTDLSKLCLYTKSLSPLIMAAYMNLLQVLNRSIWVTECI